MTKIKQLEIANYCYAFVSVMFAEFHNLNMRGDKFTWTNFPSMMEKLARAQVFTSVSMTKKTQVEIEDKAAAYAKEISNTLIKRAGYI